MIVVIDSVTGKVVTGPEIHARGFVEDDNVFDEIAAARRRGARDARSATGCTTPTSCSRSIRRTTGRWVSAATAAAR
ncbi:MAG: hypothetical protein WKF83_00690 [Nocardioidaceae bacterium]